MGSSIIACVEGGLPGRREVPWSLMGASGPKYRLHSRHQGKKRKERKIRNVCAYKCWNERENVGEPSEGFFSQRVLMIWKDVRLYQGSYILILAKLGPPPAGLQCYGDVLFQFCVGVSFGGGHQGIVCIPWAAGVGAVHMVSSGSSSALRFALTRGGMDRGQRTV